MFFVPYLLFSSVCFLYMVCKGVILFSLVMVSVISGVCLICFLSKVFLFSNLSPVLFLVSILLYVLLKEVFFFYYDLFLCLKYLFFIYFPGVFFISVFQEGLSCGSGERPRVPC